MSSNVKGEEYKRDFINYIDIIIAFMNSLIIILPLIFVHKIIFISIIGILLACGNFGLIFYRFIKNNPFYVYYCYVLLFYGLLFLLPSIWINPILAILFIPELIYIFSIYQGKSQASALSSRAKYEFMKKFGVQFGLNAQRLSQQWDGINPELESIRQKHRELLEEKYNSKKILINSLLLSLAWLVIFVFYTITFLFL